MAWVKIQVFQGCCEKKGLFQEMKQLLFFIFSEQFQTSIAIIILLCQSKTQAYPTIGGRVSIL